MLYIPIRGSVFIWSAVFPGMAPSPAYQPPLHSLQTDLSLAALRALPTQVRRVFQVDVDFLSVEGQLDTIDPPRAFDAENLSIKLSVLHGQPPAPILA